jgi:hypothetical protein
MRQARPAERWRARTAVGVVLLAALAGCDGGESPSPAPLEPSPSSASPTEPSGSPAPTLPAEAQASSVPGSKAFAHHFVELLNFASSTGDVRPIDDASTRRCVSCSAISRNIERIYRSGGRIEGSGITLDVVTPITRKPQVTLLLGVTYGAEKVVRPGKPDVRRAPSKGSLTMYLDWTDAAWLVDRLVVVQ